MRAHRIDASRIPSSDRPRPLRVPRRRDVARLVRRHPTTESVLELQRTAGNQVTRRLLLAGTQGAAPVVQRAPYGLEKQPVQTAYTDQAVQLRKTQPDMTLEHFVDALMRTIAAAMKADGVPPFTWTFLTKGGAIGVFNSTTWKVEVNVAKFTSRPGVTPKLVKDLTVDEITEVIGTLYHESRHTDQDVLVIRSLLDQGKKPAQIFASTQIRKDVIKAVATTRYAAPLDAAQTAQAGRMFDVMYGTHKQVLQFLVDHSDAYDGLEKLSKDGSNLAAAAPHIATFATWQPRTLQPKITALSALTSPTQVEKDLLARLQTLDKALTDLRGAFTKATGTRKPKPDDVDDTRLLAEDARAALQEAYVNLESEADAFRVEGQVKTAFGAKLAKP